METESVNLINFTGEDNEQTTNQNNSKLHTNFPLIGPPERLSLDNNNPFDLIQKLSICRQDDPFEVVEKEASIKAIQSFSSTSINDVKVGNLLSLSGDNDLDGAQASVFSNSTIYESAESNDLENESPPITLSTKWTPDSLTPDSGGLSCESTDSSTKQSNSIRNRKQKHCRNRLLKISISNSTYSTPMSSRKLVDDNVSESILSIHDKNEEHMIAAESPLKSMYDDLMSETPLETNYTEKDFDADLELMQIPMLNQVKPDSDLLCERIVTNAEKSPKSDNKDQDVSSKELSTVRTLPDLESIRSKLRAKRLENNNHEIHDLIKNLKTLICESNIVDEQKKTQVNGLLETLSSTLTTAVPNEQAPVPQQITRQGTFNCDLHKTNDHNSDLIVIGEKPNDSAEVSDHLNVLHQKPIEDMPDVMVKSSATYDGETAEDKEYLNLPLIDPPSPPKEQFTHPNLNDIMEQIQYLLEHHQLSSSKQSEGSNSSQANGSSTVGSNPTYIVVMPTISHQESEDLNENSHNFSTMRRRSQSLSIHDKLKIVHLPIKPPIDANLSDTYESPPLSGTSISILDSDGPDFKTPSRIMPRRNSFSSATPYTPMRHSRFSNDKARNNGSESTAQCIASPARRFSIMDTHTEFQRTEPIRPPNLGIIKPDPKKKVKTTTTSIVKSNGPLKATLSVKNIAQNLKSNARSSSLNTSMQLLARSGHISNTSTPMPELRSNELQVVGKAIPSACSTPTICAPSPGKYTGHAARYSNASVTPIGKTLAVPTAAAAALRRRTLSEFKAKSPIKTRSGAALSSVSNNASNLTKPSLAKSNILRAMTNSKTSIKTRSSVNGTSAYLANRNKENKPH